MRLPTERCDRRALSSERVVGVVRTTPVLVTTAGTCDGDPGAWMVAGAFGAGVEVCAVA